MNISGTNLPLNALRAFEAVAQAKSFTLGADALNIAQSACSRHIARLEELIGRQLFVRAGKNIHLTETGAYLYPVVQRAFASLHQAMEHVSAGTDLRLHVPPTFVQTVGAPFIQQFKSAHPDLTLTVTSSYEVGGGVDDCDVAVIFDRVDAGGDKRHLLWPIEMTPVCSVRDAARYREMGLANMLLREELLHVRLEGYPQNFLWQSFAQANGIGEIRQSTLMFETAVLAIEFARSGAGIALADTQIRKRDLAAQGLEIPFDISAPSGFGYYVVQARLARKHKGATELRRFIERLPDWQGKE